MLRYQDGQDLARPLFLSEEKAQHVIKLNSVLHLMQPPVKSRAKCTSGEEMEKEEELIQRQARFSGRLDSKRPG